MSVPVEVRSNELKQLDDWTPRVEQRLRDVASEDNGLDEEADMVARLYDEHISGLERGPVSMPADDWRALIRHMHRIQDDEGVTRVWYLQKKLIKRLQNRLEELEE